MAVNLDTPVGANLTRTDASPEFALGTVGAGDSVSRAVYVRMNGTGSSGQVVTIDSSWDATPGLKTNLDKGHPAAVLYSAPADNEYCWAILAGMNITVQNGTSGLDANARLSLGATTGKVLLNASANTELYGAWNGDTSAVSSENLSVMWHNPHAKGENLT